MNKDIYKIAAGTINLQTATVEQLISLAQEHRADEDLGNAVSITKGTVFYKVALLFKVHNFKGHLIGSYLTFEYDEDGDLEIL